MNKESIQYVVRPITGFPWAGGVGVAETGFAIDLEPGDDVSLNLRPSDVARYDRAGADLLITLADGRVIVLEDYFTSDPENESRLFLSATGAIVEVDLVEDEAGGPLLARYEEPEILEKWSPDEDLVFIDDPIVDEVTMLAGPGLVAAGLGPIAAAGLGGAALLLSAPGDDDPQNQRIPPTVDDPDAEYRIGGEDPRVMPISGTATPGSTVTATIGESTLTATAGPDRIWRMVFEGPSFPGDGRYPDVLVIVTEGDGTVTELDGPSFDVDTTPPDLRVEYGAVSTDDIFNAEDHAAGVTISGSAEIGSTVVIDVAGVSRDMVVGADGRWSFVFDNALLPAGEYVESFSLAAIDAFGNRTELRDAVAIDTDAPPLTIDPVTGDDLLNDAEAGAGFAITGTSSPGATVTVGFAGIERDVTVGADGVWTTFIDAGAVVAGEYEAAVTARTVDTAGNASNATSAIRIDTVTELSFDNVPLTGDDLINAEELARGITLEGRAEPGSAVDVTVGGVTQSVAVAADGSWTARFDAAVQPMARSFAVASAAVAPALPGGTYDATVIAEATDPAGNTASVSHGFTVDTEVSVTIDTGRVEGDGVVNAVERGDGVVVTGQAEAGASVVVTVEGAQFDASVDATGLWSVTLPAGIVPEGERSLQIGATATDAAGNVATASGTIAIDTRTGVTVDTSRVEGDGVVNAVEQADGVTLTGQAEAGASVTVTLGAISRVATVAGDGSWSVDFAAAEIPTGERVLAVSAIATDAAGNTATTAATLDIDTLVRDFASTVMPGGADAIVNAAEAAQGVSFGGTTEPGSGVVVTLAGVQKAATVAADGSWSVGFAPAELPSGEQTATMTAVATDRAGNTDTITRSVRFDTDAGILTIDPDPVETDDVVNFVEASDGVVLTGTSNPGQIVQVTLAGVTRDVPTDAGGHWRAPFTASEVAPGTYTAQITATITDSAGNTLTRTDSVKVDTEVVNFAISDAPVEGDGVVNAAEAADGVRLTGTTEPGSTVEVVFEGMAYAADVDRAGNWTVDFPSGAIPRGESTAPVVVNTTDPAGNAAQLTSALTIDTEVNRLSLATGLFTADGVLNAAEADLGLALRGQVEAGSQVVVTLDGVRHVASVDAAGGWSVDIAAADIPRGELTERLLIEATDAAGNTRSITETLRIDTEAPDAPVWVDYTRGHDGLNSITTDSVADAVEIGHLVPLGGGFVVEDVTVSSAFDIPDVGTYHRFSAAVADGSHLVVSYTDAAGNTSGTLLVTDEIATNALSVSNGMAQALGTFQVETIDLQFAEDTALTITEAQIVALSDRTDTVTVLGGSDDSVTILGATEAGATRVDGQNFNLYTLGDATILIDDDITSVNTGVV